MHIRGWNNILRYPLLNLVCLDWKKKRFWKHLGFGVWRTRSRVMFWTGKKSIIWLLTKLFSLPTSDLGGNKSWKVGSIKERNSPRNPFLAFVLDFEKYSSIIQRVRCNAIGDFSNRPNWKILYQSWIGNATQNKWCFRNVSKHKILCYILRLSKTSESIRLGIT